MGGREGGRTQLKKRIGGGRGGRSLVSTCQSRIEVSLHEAQVEYGSVCVCVQCACGWSFFPGVTYSAPCLARSSCPEPCLGETCEGSSRSGRADAPQF